MYKFEYFETKEDSVADIRRKWESTFSFVKTFHGLEFVYISSVYNDGMLAICRKYDGPALKTSAIPVYCNYYTGPFIVNNELYFLISSGAQTFKVGIHSDTYSMLRYDRDKKRILKEELYHPKMFEYGNVIQKVNDDPSIYEKFAYFDNKLFFKNAFIKEKMKLVPKIVLNKLDVKQA